MAAIHAFNLRAGLAPIADKPVFCLRRGKVPYGRDCRPLRGEFSSPELQANLMPLAEGLVRARGRGDFDGVGLAFFPGCGVVGLDLDHVITGAKLTFSEEQQEALKAVARHAFVEVSMSGTGLHAFFVGDAVTVKLNGEVEVFGDRNFIALTGRLLSEVSQC